MGWTGYKLVYQAKSPIHIGWHTLGYIKLTRYHITGKAMWGAMTANLSRTLDTNKQLEDHYKDVGSDLMNKHIMASYFYPACDPDRTPMLPQYTETGLRYGKYSKEDFERLFIKSYGQTAVVPESNTAEDETLHESEFISPVVYEKDKQKAVYFVGYIFISDDAEYNGCKVQWENLESAISELFVGGDRKYGWGRLNLINKMPASDMFGINVDNFPQIKIPAGSPIPAHLAVNTPAKLKGDIEPLVGREWGEVKEKNNEIVRKGFGQYITGAKICWVPGSIIEEDKPLKFKIGDYGVFE